MWIARTPEVPPPTLWVEWRLHSNHPKSPYFYICDARVAVYYRDIFEVLYMYGDAAISQSGDDFLSGLDIDEFHTYRFESLDGHNFWFSVDGLVFTSGYDDEGTGVNFLQFGGSGGCIGDQIPDMVNEWDFVRYGTISYGEQIIASDPPGGYVDARQYVPLDRFTVTFDSPNYVYLDEVTVEVTGGVAPGVIQTSRRDNDEPDTVEIVLDCPIPFGETTRFTFNDGVAINVVEYTFAPGDIDGDGDADLHDFAAFQRCFGQTDPTGPCSALDLQTDDTIDLADFSLFKGLFDDL